MQISFLILWIYDYYYKVTDLFEPEDALETMSYEVTVKCVNCKITCAKILFRQTRG